AAARRGEYGDAGERGGGDGPPGGVNGCGHSGSLCLAAPRAGLTSMTPAGPPRLPAIGPRKGTIWTRWPGPGPPVAGARRPGPARRALLIAWAQRGKRRSGWRCDEIHPQCDLAPAVRHLDVHRLRAGRTAVLRPVLPGHHHPLRDRRVPDRQLRAV